MTNNIFHEKGQLSIPAKLRGFDSSHHICWHLEITPICYDDMIILICIRCRYLYIYVEKIYHEFIELRVLRFSKFFIWHYNDVTKGAMASQITSLTIVYSTVYSGADQRKHQSSASLAFVRGIHRWPVSSPHKGPVTRKMFPFDDVIIIRIRLSSEQYLSFKRHIQTPAWTNVCHHYPQVT